ncbi:MAG: metal-sensing transcriptional repressor [Nitrospinota bacterium]|nr:metal-sensing transcriptional repressor [Nitrospinota bacterium]
MKTHQTHPEIIKRLKRASGHVDKVVEMIENGKGSSDVAQQLQAVANALNKAKQIYVQDHIEHCIESVGHQNLRKFSQQIKELKEIAKYL